MAWSPAAAHPRAAPTQLSLTFYRLGLTVQGAGLTTQSFSSSINPDVHCLDFITLRQGHVHLLDAFVQLGARRGGHGGRCSGEKKNFFKNNSKLILHKNGLNEIKKSRWEW